MDFNNFHILTEAYEELKSTERFLNNLKNQIDEHYGPIDDKDWWDNPLRGGPMSLLSKSLFEMRRDFTKFIIRQTRKTNPKYRNVIINDDEILQHFKLDRNYDDIGFNARNVVGYMKTKFEGGEGIEELIKHQTIDTARGVIPWSHDEGWGQVTSIDKIDTFNKDGTGVILAYSTYGYGPEDRNIAFIRHIQIILDGVQPSHTGHPELVVGDKYESNLYKSIRIYKNGHMKVVFNSIEDRNRVLLPLLESKVKQ